VTSFYLGIDIGSASSKGVLIAKTKAVASVEYPSGGDFKVTAERMKASLLAQAGLASKDIVRTVASGFGAKMVPFADEIVTDISCHGRGVHYLVPSVRTIIDVGDLYSKALRIDGEGNLVKFVLSGKCAGGSGRILKVIAKVLHLKVEELGGLSLRSKKRVEFNTGCAVFAESEAISRIAEGTTKEDLLAGLHRALAAQVDALVVRLGIEKDVAVVGGWARDAGLVKALEEIRGYPLFVPQEPHMTAALGAAIIASESVKT
jgi:predicted CoA-substrate-specific enzyme activase